MKFAHVDVKLKRSPVKLKVRGGLKLFPHNNYILLYYHTSTSTNSNIKMEFEILSNHINYHIEFRKSWAYCHMTLEITKMNQSNSNSM